MTGVGADNYIVNDDSVKIELNNGKSVEAEMVLLCVGRRPNLANSGVEEVGIEMAPRGFIQVNEYLETSVEGIYAIGDIIPGAMLAHVHLLKEW